MQHGSAHDACILFNKEVRTVSAHYTAMNEHSIRSLILPHVNTPMLMIDKVQKLNINISAN